MRPRCAVSWCQRMASPRDFISLHKPPSDEERQKPWLKFINRPELYEMSPSRFCHYTRVCSIHFKKFDFRTIGASSKHLRSEAAPSVRQFADDPPFNPEKEFCDLPPTENYCAVKGCITASQDNLPLHRLPIKCIDRIRSWRETLGLTPEDRNRPVCSRHFGVHQYVRLDPKRASLDCNQDPMYRVGPINPIFNDYSPFPLPQVVLYEAFVKGETIDLDLILKTFEDNLNWEELKALIVYLDARAKEEGKSNFIAKIPNEPPAGLSEYLVGTIHRVHDPACTCLSRPLRYQRCGVDFTKGNILGRQTSDASAISSNPMDCDRVETPPDTMLELDKDEDPLLWYRQFEEEDVPSDNRVLVLTKHNGMEWTMGETRNATWVLIKKLLNLRLTDVKYNVRNGPGCSFSSSSLVSPKLFMILCSDVDTANVIVEDLAGDLDQEGWSANYWPDVRKPIVEAFIPGCIITKVYAMRMLEFFNRGKGLRVGAWRIKNWQKTQNGVHMEIEVPCEDAFVVQKLGTLCFELRLIKFRVKWPKEMERLMLSIVTDDADLSSDVREVHVEGQVTTSHSDVSVENVSSPDVAVKMCGLGTKRRAPNDQINVAGDRAAARIDKPVVTGIDRATARIDKPVVMGTVRATASIDKPVDTGTDRATASIDKPVVKGTDRATASIDKPVVKGTDRAAARIDKPVVTGTDRATVSIDKPVVKGTDRATASIDRPAVKGTDKATASIDKPVVKGTDRATASIDKPVVKGTDRATASIDKPVDTGTSTVSKSVKVENFVSPEVAVEICSITEKSRAPDNINILDDEATASNDMAKQNSRYQTTNTLRNRDCTEKTVKSFSFAPELEKVCRTLVTGDDGIKIWNAGGVDSHDKLNEKVICQTASKDACQENNFDGDERRKLLAQRLMKDSLFGRLLETQLSDAHDAGVKTYRGRNIRNDEAPSKLSPQTYLDAEIAYCAGSPDENVGLNREQGWRRTVAVRLADGRLIQAQLKIPSDAELRWGVCQKNISTSVDSTRLSKPSFKPTQKMNEPVESPDEQGMKLAGRAKCRLVTEFEKAWENIMAEEEAKKLTGDPLSIDSNTGVKVGSCRKNKKNRGSSAGMTPFLRSSSGETHGVEMIVIPDENLQCEAVQGDGIVIQDVRSVANSAVKDKKNHRKRMFSDDTGSKQKRKQSALQDLNEREVEEDFKLNISSVKIMKTYCKPCSLKKTDQSQGADCQSGIHSEGSNDRTVSDDSRGVDGLSMPLSSPWEVKSLLNINGEIIAATEEDMDSSVLIT